MAYRISDQCIKCGCCAAACPVQCISEGDTKYVIDETKCIGCGICAIKKALQLVRQIQLMSKKILYLELTKNKI